MSQQILNSIAESSKVIGKTWPLYTFVASNPLSGYENTSFLKAVTSAHKHFNANAFPAAKIYSQAWEKREINKEVLLAHLKENGLSESPEYYLNLIASEHQPEALNNNHIIDRIMAKWLSAFMDEGLAEWDMPFKTEGFYGAWLSLIRCTQKSSC